MQGADHSVGPGQARCPNCSRVVNEEDMFCSVTCEREWMKREVAKAEKEGIRFCPRCGSTRIKAVTAGIMNIWSCQECDYRGSLTIKDGEIRTKIRERYDEAHGKGTC